MSSRAHSRTRHPRERFWQSLMLWATLPCLAWLWCSPAVAQQTPPVRAPARATPSVAPAPPGTPATSRQHELDASGYIEQEHVLRGQAATYSKASEWGRNGLWTPQVRDAAQPYETRLLVRRPQDPARFNGVVLVEWLNTSLGFDLDGAWIATRDELLREGYAWVGVSPESDSIAAIQAANPSRYARASIDSEDRGFDIYTDAAQVVREMAAHWRLPTGPAVRLVGTGYSQSGSFIYTYINTFHPRTRAYDGYYLRGAAWAAIPLNRWDINTYRFDIRADVDVPLMIVQSEAESKFSNVVANALDNDRIRLWEVAGTTHLDQHIQDGARTLRGTQRPLGPARCNWSVNSMPLHHIDHAAIHGLRQWLTTGQAPPKAPRMLRNDWGFVQDDSLGHAVGGLRLPELEAPLARHGVFGNFPTRSLALWESFACLAGGTVKPLSAQEIRARYPDERAYQLAYRQSADRLLQAGFLRPADHAAMIKQAMTVRLPR